GRLASAQSLHLIGEAAYRATHSHPRRIDGAHAESLCDLRHTPLHLDARDDELAIFWFETRERLTIALVRFRLNRGFERRRAIGWMILWELRRRRVTSDLPHLVTNAVDHRLPEIALHRTDMPWLEEIEPFNQAQCSVLHQVVRIQAAARGGRQPAVRPALE